MATVNMPTTCMLLSLLASLLCLGSSSSTLTCNVSMPATPHAGSFTIVEDNNSSSGCCVGRFQCVAGFHLIGEAEIPCSEIDNAALPTCATDAARLGLVRAQQSSGVYPRRPITTLATTTTINKVNSGKTCSFTSSDNDPRPWWRAVLSSVSSVSRVRLRVRAPTSGFLEIRVGNDTAEHTQNPLCQHLRLKRRGDGGFINVDAECSAVGKTISVSATRAPLSICHLAVLVNGEAGEEDGSSEKCLRTIDTPGATDGGMFFSFRGRCIYLDLENRVDYDKASTFCQSKGMKPLMSLYEEEEEVEKVYGEVVAAVRTVYQGGGDNGGKSVKYGASVSDAKKKRKRLFVWVGKRPLDPAILSSPSLWGVGEPSKRPGDDCVALDSALGWRWNAVRCVVSAAVVCTEQVRCPRPRVHRGLKLTEEKDFYDLGETAEYECRDANQILMDEGRRVCGQGGRWTGEGQEHTCHSTVATTTIATTTTAPPTTTLTSVKTTATATARTTSSTTAAKMAEATATTVATEAATLADSVDNNLSDLTKSPSTVENLLRNKANASNSNVDNNDGEGKNSSDDPPKSKAACSITKRTMLMYLLFCLVISLFSRSQLSFRQY